MAVGIDCVMIARGYPLLAYLFDYWDDQARKRYLKVYRLVNSEVTCNASGFVLLI